VAEIVLIYPETGLDLKGVSVWLPLSVLHVASTLVPDFEVAIIDQRTDPLWKESLRRSITDRTLCVGISTMTGTQIRGGLAAARIVRERRPDLPIVWGGNHPTLAPESTICHPLVDIVVMGEGEVTFRRLVEALAKKKDWRAIPNLCFEADGRIMQNGTGTTPADFSDPDVLPPLPYHLVEVEEYIAGPGIFGRPLRSLPYISSQGCPWNCAFCCQPVLSSRRWRRQDERIVLERTMELKERFRLDAIEFHDEEFFVDRRRGARIAEAIGGRYEWYVQTRMDDLLALDLAALERHGLRAVQPGIESGSPRIIEMIKKGESIEQFLEANRRLGETAIRPTYNFMMGYPTETREDLEATVDLALRLIDENRTAQISGFYVYVPYPGAELFTAAVRDGFRPPETLEGWSVFNRQHLATPWITANREAIETLLFTSKFIDGRRLRTTFAGKPLAPTLIGLFSNRYRAKWRRHDLTKSSDVALPAAAARLFFGW
jgi:radical SAM superfamily enzyme YgiQ (UPF0313 family)